MAMRCIRGIRFRLLAKHRLPSFGLLDSTVSFVKLHGDTSSANFCSFGYKLKNIILLLRPSFAYSLNVCASSMSPFRARISSSCGSGSSTGIIP